MRLRFIVFIARPPPGFNRGLFLSGAVAERFNASDSQSRERVSARSEGPNPSGPATILSLRIVKL